MTTVYFVRHAQPNYENHVDSLRELTAKGLADRKLVTGFLANKQVDVVLSSPYRRAVDTVKDFADTYGYEIEQIEDFRERKVGDGWIEDFQGFAKRQWEDFDYRLPDGESLRQVRQRNIGALQGVLRRYRDKNIVIGSHGTALSMVIHYYQPGFGLEEFYTLAQMPWIVEFRFDGESCVSIVSHDLFEASEKILYKKRSKENARG